AAPATPASTPRAAGQFGAARVLVVDNDPSALAATAALLVHGLADFALDTREGLLVLGALLGLAAGSGVPEAPAGRGLAAATLAAVLLAAGALWHTQARPGFAQQRLEAAQDAFAYGNDAGEALEQIGQALEWQPNDPALWERRAAYRLAMRDAGALGDLRRAIELSPASAGLRDALAQALLAARQPRAAADAAREAVELHPLDAGHRLTLAEALLALDDREGARSELESAGKLQRNRAEQFRLDTLTAALAGGGA
ncbi:MAG: hypothetical protein SF028_08425, partial [Candidatus Sumerlaeia bacterium]|nr:hypothetical protein [Candidatus Sumerlaeia bacterium]